METISKLSKWYGPIAIAFGLILCLYGFKMIAITVAFLLFLSISALFFMFTVLIVFGATLTDTKVIVAMIISIAIGIAGAYFLT